MYTHGNINFDALDSMVHSVHEMQSDKLCKDIQNNNSNSETTVKMVRKNKNVCEKERQVFSGHGSEDACIAHNSKEGVLCIIQVVLMTENFKEKEILKRVQILILIVV